MANRRPAPTEARTARRQIKLPAIATRIQGSRRRKAHRVPKFKPNGGRTINDPNPVTVGQSPKILPSLILSWVGHSKGPIKIQKSSSIPKTRPQIWCFSWTFRRTKFVSSKNLVKGLCVTCIYSNILTFAFYNIIIYLHKNRKKQVM